MAAPARTAPHPAPTLTRRDFAVGMEAILPALRGYARRLTRDPAESEDLVQESLLRAWAARAQFRAGTNLRAWMFRIVRNGFLSQKRKSWRQVDLDPEIGELLSPCPADQETALLMADLDRALSALPSGHRDALLMVTRDGLSYAETADIMAIPDGTVRSRVSRARSAIVKYMQGDAVLSQNDADLAAARTAIPEPVAIEAARYRQWKSTGRGSIG